ncbi:hypothetical protein N331_06004, partial [Merops nubicus]
VGTCSLNYGVEFCTPCKAGMITRVLSATSTMDCVKKERTEQVLLMVHKIPDLVLIIVPALLAMNFLLILSSCYLFYGEYQKASPRASKTTGSTMRMDTETSCLEIPRQGSQAGPDAGPTSETNHLDTSSSQGTEEEHTHGAPTLAVTPHLAAVTDETAPVLTLGDRKDTF